ncbi:hypothetical protein AAHE18_13G002900 [Arachis hypogaea]|uniref:GDSL esterase/lipase n=1 Tax=Arachis hypogaea TaxID=3818 RepID=A0A445AAZ7_ARAHY|nr:hypothetical protein Ahy_B03g068837 [Arachis hypogaea]
MKNMLIIIIFLAADEAMNLLSMGYRDPAVPAVYIFGDSTFDVGTNNFLNDTKSKADMPFYGIDYSPSHSKPTGRFSNGYNTADCIVQLLGFKESPPPFLYLVQNDTEDFNTQILKGVNFAGGGAGILHHTGKQRFGRVISMEEQIQQFSSVGDNMTRYLNESAAKGIINKSLILISVGSNDINEFLMFNVSNSSSLIQQLQQFLPDLIASYQAHLTNLISLGARKFGILGLAPLGSVPDVRGSYGGNSSNEINAVAELFNYGLYYMLLDLNSSKFPEFKFSFGNTYSITTGMINNPASLGLSDVATACCGNQTLTSGTPCSPNATVCEFRHKFLFWDRHHPTEYGSQLAANDLFNGGSEFASPFNLSTLVQTL